MKRPVFFLTLLLFCGAYGIASATQTAPCYLGMGKETTTCQNPFAQGIVDGQWVGLVLYLGKTPVFSVVHGGSVWTDTVLIGTIDADEGAGGWSDNMEARFVGSKLWFITPYHLPGQEGHYSYTHFLVRQYGVVGRVKLQLERETIVTCTRGPRGEPCWGPPENGSIARALQQATP